MNLLSQGTQWLFPNVNSVQGYVDPRFSAIKKDLMRVLPKDGGASIAVFYKGALVVDIWAGQKSPDESWQADSMALCFSTGKGVLATLAHIIVKEYSLSYDVDIREYWPEFGVNHKHVITLKHLLTHQTGLYGIRNVTKHAVEMLYWDKMLDVYAKARPRFKPETDTVYHAISFGFLLGGVLEKVTKKPLAQLLDEYLVQPLGLDGAFFGVPETQLGRVARTFKHYERLQQPQKSLSIRLHKTEQRSVSQALLASIGIDLDYMRDASAPHGVHLFDIHGDKSLQACIPGFNGVFTARSLAKIYAMMASGGLFEGREYLGAAQFDRVSSVVEQHRDKALQLPMHWRLGYHRVFTLGKQTKQAFGHMGINGAGAFCDPSRALSFAYIHNDSHISKGLNPKLLWLQHRVLQLVDKIQ